MGLKVGNVLRLGKEWEKQEFHRNLALKTGMKTRCSPTNHEGKDNLVLDLTGGL